MKIENRIKIGRKHSELCLFLFFVKNVNFDQIWENHNFQKLANFRMKIIPNEDSFGLILKKTFSSVISYEKRMRFTLFLLIKGQNYSKILNFTENAEDHNFGTEHARNVTFLSKCAVLYTVFN